MYSIRNAGRLIPRNERGTEGVFSGMDLLHSETQDSLRQLRVAVSTVRPSTSAAESGRNEAEQERQRRLSGILCGRSFCCGSTLHMDLFFFVLMSKIHLRYKPISYHMWIEAHVHQNEGFLPEAVVNFVAFLGWSPPDHQEVLTLPEMIKKVGEKTLSHNEPKETCCTPHLFHLISSI